MDWNRIIFSDETTVRLNQLKRCVWNLSGKRKVFRTVKYPIKVNIWGCFSCNGFGRICCFRENLKADLLCRIYKRYLLPIARDHFGQNSTNWALQEDNDPKDTSQLAKQWRSKYEVQRIEWISMSPDLSPIRSKGHIPSWQNNGDRSMKSNESNGYQCHQTSVRSKTFGSFSK